MQLRYKVMLLAVVPLVLAVGLLAFVVEREGKALVDRQVGGIKTVLPDVLKDTDVQEETKKLLQAAEQAGHRAKLQLVMAIAQRTIRSLVDSGADDEETQSKVLDQLRALSFGEDGYFYVYDVHGKCLMHPRLPELVGRDMWDFRDDTGQLVIQPLIDTATKHPDGGFREYRWQRPSRQRWSQKLGYVVLLPRWGWMLGTGIYLDKPEELARQIYASSASAIGDTMFSIAVIAVLAVSVVAALGVALNVRQQRLADAKLRKLTWQVVAAQETERARVARYLHDEAVQDLIAVKCDLETALIELTSDPPYGKLTERLKQGVVGLATGVEQIRTISRDLRPPLQGDGLPVLLERTGAAFSARTGVAAAVAAPATGQALSSEAATALLRVTQQALDNVERHARASRVAIQLAACSRGGSSGLRVTVRDDGCGFDVAAVELRRGGGIGLLNMRERIEALGGRLAIRSGPDGTEIEAFLPSEAPYGGRPS